MQLRQPPNMVEVTKEFLLCTHAHARWDNVTCSAMCHVKYTARHSSEVLLYVLTYHCDTQ